MPAITYQLRSREDLEPMAKGALYYELRQADSGLADNLDEIYRESLKIWTEQSLWTFTAHGESHIAQVERNLDRLTRPLVAAGSPLVAEEIYVLLAACFLHDIGMQLDVPDARERHAEHSFDLILDSFDTRFRALYVRLPIADPNAREAIALVARAHWTTFALQLPSEDYIYGYANKRGRLRLLGALLAMADLLDLSPARARYFRSAHKLYELPPISELHQTMHQLVKGFDIGPPNPQVPGDLRFTVEWRDDSGDTRLISDWILHWFTSQWRQLGPVLHEESGGAIRWSNPWTKAVFRQPLGAVATLTAKARSILEAERREQLRIDRDEFCRAFLEALKEGQRALFLLPWEAGDASPMCDWCEAHARKLEGLRVARLDVLQSEAPDLVSLIALLLEQWDHHLADYTENAALSRLESLEADGRARGSAIVPTSDTHSALFENLLAHLFRILKGALVVAYFSPAAAGPDSVEDAALYRPSWADILEADLEAPLRMSWGYNGGDARRLAADASGYGLCRSPGPLYRFVERQGKAWDNIPTPPT